MTDIAKIANAMRERAPWLVARKMLITCGVSCSQGWDKTLEKIDPSIIPGSATANLLEAYNEHILCGEKEVYFFEQDPSNLTVLRNHYKSIQLDTSDPFVSEFPFTVKNLALSKNPSTPLLVHTKETSEGLAAIYSSIRETEIRDSYDSTMLPPNLIKTLGNASVVIAIRRERKQVFDVVWIPTKSNNVEIRLDMPAEIKSQAASIAFHAIKKSLSGIVNDSSFESPSNIFPLIKKIYESSEGNVVEMAFVTTTASSKHEKMRKKQLCLREETYHKGGRLAVDNDIDPYRIAVQWTIDKGKLPDSKPELALYSSAKELFNGNPTLRNCHITGCTSLTDYTYVCEKIATYL
jgi:hypothetical protein